MPFPHNKHRALKCTNQVESLRSSSEGEDEGKSIALKLD